MKFVVLFLILLSSIVAAEPVHLSFWHAFSGDREACLKLQVEKFQQLNPEIIVELKSFTDPRRAGNDYAELYKNLLRALAEGKPPVVVQMYENWVTQLADVKQLLPLDWELAGVWKDMPAIFLQASTHTDGKRYSVPFNKSLWTLYANNHLFEAKEPPQNWSEFRLACFALKEQFSYGRVAIFSPFDLFDLHFVSQGGYFFNAHKQPGFAGPLGMASGGFLQAISLQDGSCIYGTKAYQLFLDGRLPFLIDTSAKLVTLEKALGQRLSIFPLPRGAGDRIQLTGTQLAILSRSTLAQKRAGLRLLRFLTSPEQTRDWAIATGYLPVRESVFHDPVYLEWVKARPGRTVIVGELARAQVQPQIVGWEATRVTINDALERTLYQKFPIDRELITAQTVTARLLRGLQGKQ